MENDIDDAELNALEAKAQAATPGLWLCWNGYGPDGNGEFAVGRIGPADKGMYAGLTGSGGRDILGRQADLDWVAAANPATILRLIAQLRAVAAERNALWIEADPESAVTK